MPGTHRAACPLDTLFLSWYNLLVPNLWEAALWMPSSVWTRDMRGTTALNSWAQERCLPQPGEKLGLLHALLPPAVLAIEGEA